MKSFRVFHKLKRIHKQSLYIVSALVLSVSVLAQVPFPAFAVPTFTEYPLTTGYKSASQIVSAGGLVWYLNANSSSMPYLSSITTSGTINNYSLLPTGYTAIQFSGARYLNVDSMGKIWFAGCATPPSGVKNLLLGYMDPSTTTLTFFPQTNYTCTGGPSSPSYSSSAIDTNDKIWVASHWNGAAGATTLLRFNQSGTYSGGYNPNTPAPRNWTDFTAGPNNNLWIADSKNNQIFKLTLDPTTSAVTGSTSYPLTFAPGRITIGPDGNLWFEGGNAANKMDLSGNLTQYASPTGYVPSRFTIGPDGALWVALNSSTYTAQIARVDTSTGITRSYTVPTSGSSVPSMVAGPDGALWFVEQVSSSAWKIVKMDITPTSQTISFTSTAPTASVIDGATYTPTATATSGLPVAVTVDSSSSSICTIVSGVVSFQGAGTCMLNANQGGDVDYNPAPRVQQSFTVAPVDADSSVGVSCPSTAHVGDPITCTITIDNAGPAAAENASLSALFSNLFSGTSLTGGGTLSGQSITWSATSIASGASTTTLTFSATASVASKASFSAALLQTNPDPDISNNIAEATIVIS